MSEFARLNPINDDDRWAAVAALSARFGRTPFSEILRAVRASELDVVEDVVFAEVSSRVDWRTALAAGAETRLRAGRF